MRYCKYLFLSLMLLSGSVLAVGDTYFYVSGCVEKTSEKSAICSAYGSSDKCTFNSVNYTISYREDLGKCWMQSKVGNIAGPKDIYEAQCSASTPILNNSECLPECPEGQAYNDQGICEALPPECLFGEHLEGGICVPDGKQPEDCDSQIEMYSDIFQLCVQSQITTNNPDDCAGNDTPGCDECTANGGTYASAYNGTLLDKCIPGSNPDPEPDPDPEPEPDPDPDPDPDPEPDPELEAQNITNNITNNNTTNNSTTTTTIINNYGDGEGDSETGEEGEEESYSDYQTPDSQIDEAVPEMGQSFSDFYDSIMDSPIIESVENIADSIPDGGSCPTYDFSIAYFNRTYTIDAHCILFPDIAWILSVCMMGAWSIGATFVFLKA